MTSDRGLCGGFNGNIVRKSVEFLRQCEAARTPRRSQHRRPEGPRLFSPPSMGDPAGMDRGLRRLSFEHAIDIGGDLTDNFVKGTFDELYVVYNEFKSAIQQRVIVEKLFPVDAAVEFERDAGEGRTRRELSLRTR